MSLFVPRDRRSLFRQFLTGMYDAVVITDPNGYIIEINPRTVEYFGYATEELQDKPVSLVIPGLKQDVTARIRKGLEEGNHVVLDVNGLAKGGRKVACEVAVSSIDLLNPGDLIFTIRNVERRREYMNSFFAKANAFHIAHVALFGCDVNGNIRDCNEAFCEMFGLADVEEARKHVFSDLMGDDPLPENFKKAMAGERTVSKITAEGDDGKEELEIVLAPNMHRRHNHGVVGSIIRL